VAGSKVGTKRGPHAMAGSRQARRRRVPSHCPDRSRAGYPRGMSMPTDHPLPPYQLAAGKLRKQIQEGKLKPGDRLPSSRELRTELGIANATVHSALRVLRDEGLVYSVPNRGTYVSSPGTDLTGEFKIESTAPAWYSAAKEQASPGDEAAPSPVTEPLAQILEQMHQMGAEVTALKQHVETLEEKVHQLEQKDAR
jgi:DNA-binding transcriptional regulator YhcF (GntR family)